MYLKYESSFQTFNMKHFSFGQSRFSSKIIFSDGSGTSAKYLKVKMFTNCRIYILHTHILWSWGVNVRLKHVPLNKTQKRFSAGRIYFSFFYLNYDGNVQNSYLFIKYDDLCFDFSHC